MRSTRIAKFLVREAVHYDPETRMPVRHMERGSLLKKYAGQPDVFGTFTAILPQGRENKDQGSYNLTPKLGINPSSKYNTPVGIYSYSVSYLLDSYNVANGSFDVPFPIKRESREYLQVFKVKDLDRCLIFTPGETKALIRYKIHGNIKSLTQDKADGIYYEVRDYLVDFNEQFKKLVEEFPMSEVETSGSIDRLIYLPLQYYYDQIYDIDQIIGEMVSATYNLEKTGLVHNRIKRIKERPAIADGILSSTLLAIKTYLKTQVDVPDFQFPYEDRLQALPETPKGDEYINFRDIVLNERVACDTAYIWNATRHLAKKNSRKWVGLLRRMGFIGAIDHDTGTIHPNEPEQAVFFDSGALKTLDVIHEQPKQYKSDPGLQRRMVEFTRGQIDAVDELLLTVNHSVSGLIDHIKYCINLIKNPHEGVNPIYRSNEIVKHNVDRAYSDIGWLNTHALKDPRWNRQVRSTLAQKIRDQDVSMLPPEAQKRVEFIVKVIGGARV